jgi:hypothetical protein
MDVKTNKEISKEVKKGKSEGRHKVWILAYVIIALICLAVYFLLQFRVFGLLGTYRPLFQRLSLAGFVVHCFYYYKGSRVCRYQTISNKKRAVQYYTSHKIAQLFCSRVYCYHFFVSEMVHSSSFTWFIFVDTWLCIANAYFITHRLVLYHHSYTISHW